jgi:hypothetical protein
MGGAGIVAEPFRAAGAVEATRTAGAPGGMNIGNLLAAGAGAASLAAEPPELDITETGDKMARARESVMTKYLGEEAAAQLPSVVSENYLDMITKPIGELYPVEKDARWGRLEKEITDSYDDYEDAINQQFAQAGGSGSSDHREAIRNARADRAAELSQSRNELEQDMFDTQIKIKQDALMRAAEQGQFDDALAFELARLIGEEEELNRALAMDDYDTFQRVMGMIMAMGLQSPMPDYLSVRGGGARA